uniref:Uncharacterized protein n=1 Tax=viral metagenome TaxID=1070528 RepID=A0A6M3K345_9ZZZZ
MATEKEIKAKYKAQHDSLTEDYYKNKLMSKDDFDLQHGQNWIDMEVELIVGGFFKPLEPVRDLKAEIDELRAEINKLKGIK